MEEHHLAVDSLTQLDLRELEGGALAALPTAAVVPKAQIQMRQRVGFVKRRGWIVVLVPILAVGLMRLDDAHKPKLYQADMSILVAQTGGAFQPQVGNQALTQTITNILTSDVIAQRVVDRLGLRKMKAADLLAGLKVNVKPNSSVLDVTYESHHRAKALAVLRGVSAAFQYLVHEKLGISGSLRNTGPLLVAANVFDPPHLAPLPVSPKPKKDMLYAGVLGFALGIILAWLAESLDDRIREESEAETAFGAKVVSRLKGRLPSNAARAVTTRRRWRRGRDEGLRRLRATVQLSRRRAGVPRTYLVANAGRRDATDVAANLALALARAGETVICVDATPARKLAPFFDVPAEPGLADVLEGSAELEAVIHTVGPTSSDENEDGPRLFVVPAGRPTLDAASMLASPRLDGVLDGLSGAADYVIVVGPSVNSADVLPVAAAADEAILVAQPGRTTRADAKAARDVLDRVAASGRSVVFARGRRLPSLR